MNKTYCCQTRKQTILIRMGIVSRMENLCKLMQDRRMQKNCNKPISRTSTNSLRYVGRQQGRKQPIREIWRERFRFAKKQRERERRKKIHQKLLIHLLIANRQLLITNCQLVIDDDEKIITHQAMQVSKIASNNDDDYVREYHSYVSLI